MNLKKIKYSARKVGLITLAATLFNPSLIKSQGLEAKVNDELNFTETSLHEISDKNNNYGELYNKLYDNLLFASNSETQKSSREQIKEMMHKPPKISKWVRFKILEGGVGTPTSLIYPYRFEVFELAFSIIPRLGIGFVLVEGHNGASEPLENVDLPMLPIPVPLYDPNSMFIPYLEFPIWIRPSIPKSYTPRGEWTQARMATSVFVGKGSLFGGYNEEDPRPSWEQHADKEGYLHAGINHTLFVPYVPIDLNLEGGIFLKESGKLRDSFYGSFNLGLVSLMFVKLK